MNIPNRYLKLMFLLPIIGSIVFLTTDQIGPHLKQAEKSTSTKREDKELIHTHDEEVMDHKNPEVQKRMDEAQLISSVIELLESNNAA